MEVIKKAAINYGCSSVISIIRKINSSTGIIPDISMLSFICPMLIGQ